MNNLNWFLILHIFFVSLISKVHLEDVDPFDMRDYDPKTKTMRRTSSSGISSGVSSSLVEIQKCSDCSSFMQSYCELSSVCKHECMNWGKSKDLQNSMMLNTFLVRFVNVLLKKSRLQESKNGPDVQESLLSLRLSRNQLRILKDFGESGNTAFLRDIDEILSTQLDMYNAPLCADDYFNKFYEAKEFFSQSTFIILGIVLTAVVFFYNVFVLNKIRVALLSLIATIFFSGYFWTYWKMYEELMADLVRQARHGDVADCYAKTETFLWFFSYTVPADVKKCKEYYNARHTRPLSKLTPTLVFYETIKVFWGGFLGELGDIVIVLFKQLLENSPWYIKWTVLPLVLIFVLVALVICVAFLTGKRFKLSHPIFGAIELDTDVNYREQTKITQNEVSYKVIKSSTGPDSNLSCLSCGTTFVQAASISMITRTVAEKAENTEPENKPSLTANSSQPPNRLRNRLVKTGVAFFQRTVVSPWRQITNSRPAVSNIERTVTDGPAEFFERNEYNDDVDSEEDSEEDDNKVTLKDCSDDDDKVTKDCDSDEDKENVILCSTNSRQIIPYDEELWYSNRSPSGKEPLSSLAKFTSKSSPALLSPDKAQNLESKKKYFEEIRFGRSPNPKEKRLIPIVINEPGPSYGASGESIGNDRVDSRYRENLVKSSEKYFAKSNEKIRKQLSFKQVRAKLLTKNGSQAVELEIKNEQRILRRKLSL